MPNFKQTPQEINKLIQEEGFHEFYITDSTTISEAPPEVATHWRVVKWDDNGYQDYMGKLPKKKPITFEYIMERIAKKQNRESVNYSDLFKQIPGVGSYSIYPTSYGVGLSALYGSLKEEDLQKMKDFLDENNIEYSNEFSEARWVYRFKISQSQDNINRIKNLI